MKHTPIESLAHAVAAFNGDKTSYLYEAAKAVVEARDEEISSYRHALDFYGDPKKYWLKERIVNLQQTTAVFHVEDPSTLSTEYTMRSYECSSRLKIDQGEKAREVLARYAKGG